MRVLGIILAALVLISLVPVGLEAALGEEGFSLRARVGPLGLRLLPARPKRPPRAGTGKKKKTKKKPAEPPPEETERRGGGLGLGLRDLPELLGLALDLLGRLRRGVRIEELTVHLVFGGADGGSAVLMYGYANAALSVLDPLLHRAFQIRREDIRTAVDFDLDRTVYELRFAATLRIGRIVGAVLAAGFGALRWLLRRRARTRGQAVPAAAEEAAREVD